ncbi:histidine kinase [Qipengyuania huizhouensis]|uniref:histidine kinase n=1 Tax=Qipengyuania huizhouensis TaxID=2867245 RepID=UPI001C88DE38|nr:histidine kinase [Qipengyuania huizhouensis]MBX7461134.1 histidine kinase [Qipengyuania huizhouensis]
MVQNHAIRLLVEDPSVLASLKFSLSIEGFDVGDHDLAALIIDEQYRGDGAQALEDLRAQGNSAPAVFMATHPNRRLRSRLAIAGAVLVEKPLMGDEIGRAFGGFHNPIKAA